MPQLCSRRWANLPNKLTQPCRSKIQVHTMSTCSTLSIWRHNRSVAVVLQSLKKLSVWRVLDFAINILRCASLLFCSRAWSWNLSCRTHTHSCEWYWGPGCEWYTTVQETGMKIENTQGIVDVVSCPTFNLGLPAYYILALSEASRFDCFL